MRRSDQSEPRRVWAASGAMGLTGRVAGPPVAVPRTLPEGLATIERRLARWLHVDVPALLGERAAIAGLSRRGATSCGGGCRLLQAADGWIAVSLAREDDRAAVPAWLALDGGSGDVIGDGPFGLPDTETDAFDAIAAVVRQRPVAALVAGGVELGLPVAALGEVPVPADRPATVPSTRLGDAVPVADLSRLLVVDLSSLWAGPLCADLLGRAGMRVVKVESVHRPDGARGGPSAFYDLLHAGHESVALDFTTAAGRLALQRLVERADVVIEASRPRALAQLGVSPARSGARAWVSITAYGREGAGANRIGFGDDAAVAGGLVAWDAQGPVFCADAVADPLAGVTAALGVLDVTSIGGRWLLDVAMARVAAWMGRGAVVDGLGRVAPPRARAARGVAPALGADTARVLAELGLPG